MMGCIEIARRCDECLARKNKNPRCENKSGRKENEENKEIIWWWPIARPKNLCHSLLVSVCVEGKCQKTLAGPENKKVKHQRGKIKKGDPGCGAATVSSKCMLEVVAMMNKYIEVKSVSTWFLGGSEVRDLGLKGNRQVVVGAEGLTLGARRARGLGHGAVEVGQRHPTKHLGLNIGRGVLVLGGRVFVIDGAVVLARLAAAFKHHVDEWLELAQSVARVVNVRKSLENG